MAEYDRTDYISTISMIVMGILHKIGVNKKIRKRRRKEWLEYEQLLTFINHVKHFIFGSQVEGATTPGLKSDLDLVGLENHLSAIRDIQDIRPGQMCYLMVADEDTYPGYYKLQMIHPRRNEPLWFSNGERLSGIASVDRKGRFVLNPSRLFIPRGLVHGPAATNALNFINMDCIMGIRVNDWAHHAKGWAERPRRRKWIKHGDFKNFVQKEAFLVPVGNSESQERHLEWRISFTTVERELMWKLNNTQIGSYVLMKMIIKDFIIPAIGECLTSYQCKTALFWLIENTDKQFWKPKNLLFCFNALLKTIFLWVKGGFCPNYFIPDENIFLGKISGQKNLQLCTVLSNLINMEFRYLTLMQCDSFGEALLNASSRLCTAQMIPDDVENILDATQDAYALCVKRPIDWAKYLVLRVYIRLLKQSLYVPLRNLLVDLIQEHRSCSEALRDNLFVCIGLLSSHLGCQLFSSCFTRENLYGQEIETVHMLLQYGTSSDVTSGRLKLAGFYLKLGYPALAEEVLTAVERDLKQHVSDLSAVDEVDMGDITIQKIMTEDMTTEQTYRNCLALSVVYLQSEVHCTLKPMCYEMFRSVCADPSLRDPLNHYWYDWVVVDARPFLYFLQHQTYSALGKPNQRIVALSNMSLLLSQKRFRHHETCLNLLAYCFRQEGLVNLGLWCLSKSLRIMPKHNGAVWQIFDILAAFV